MNRFMPSKIMQDFEIIIFSSMQLNDTRIQEYGRNDGIQSILHCQDKFFISHAFKFWVQTFKCMLEIYARMRLLSDKLRSGGEKTC